MRTIKGTPDCAPSAWVSPRTKSSPEIKRSMILIGSQNYAVADAGAGILQ
jgi:hypothetical protein